MTVLDWILLALVLAYALSGYWQGFITGAFATAGLLLGGLFGVWLAPTALGNADPSLYVSLGALFIVILCASLGQAVCQWFGARIRERITWQPIRAVDAIGGAALSAAAVLMVAWALGVAVSGTRIGPVTSAVRNSTILASVNRFMPTAAASALGAFNKVVGTSFFPQYLEPFAPERVVPVEAGPDWVYDDPDIARAGPSVLKVHGVNQCGSGLEGTGFLYAPNRLMTNAHVVAGVADPEVMVGTERKPADVVYYNPDLDVAVLAFDSGALDPLRFADSTESGQGVALVGYPEDGPYSITTGRIRSQQRLRSPDIYGDGVVLREVLSLRGEVRPGNSGGPVLAEDGSVVGVVFAASVTYADTGYALTADQVSDAAAAGVSSTRPVSSGSCV